MNTLLEICIDSIESAIAAQAGGADRLEVCSSLAAGGTTPSHGLVQRCIAETGLPVMMMIRPHAGGFVYRDSDIETILADIEIAHSIGVHGIVFGALTEARHLHVEHCRRVLEAAKSLTTTFHRAFDIVTDPIESFDQIVEMGFERILTSGQAMTAEEGIPLIRQLCDRAEDRISVMAGSGVSPQNAQKIVHATGVNELHASASVAGQGQSQGGVSFGIEQRVTSVTRVRSIRQALS